MASPTRSASSSSVSVGFLFQYAIFAVAAYVLAGAPLQTLLSGKVGQKRGSTVVSYGRSEISQDKLESLAIEDRNLTCSEHAYAGVHVLSREPLVVYVEGFLSEVEVGRVLDERYVFDVGLKAQQAFIDPTSLATHIPSLAILQLTLPQRTTLYT